MDPRILLAVISLIDRSIQSQKALEAIKDAAVQAKAQGRELTLEDLKEYQVSVGPARDALVQALEEAEDS